MSINNNENHNINRGVEIMLRRRKEKDQPKLDENKFNFLKTFSFFNREIYFKIELKIIKKSNLSEK